MAALWAMRLHNPFVPAGQVPLARSGCSGADASEWGSTTRLSDRKLHEHRFTWNKEIGR